jgi:secreted trypsin-like serine protease
VIVSLHGGSALLRRLLIVLVSALLGVLGTVSGAGPAAAIAHGIAATTGQLPFAVQLRFTGITRADGTQYDSACSGGLISADWIITAGHCFHDGNHVRVDGAPRYTSVARLGTVNTTDPAAGQTRHVVLVKQSPTNDIALARLDAPVSGITPLVLASRAPARGQLLNFAGWGATTSTGSWSDQLNWGRVAVTGVSTTLITVVGKSPGRDTSACPYDSGAPYFFTPAGGRPTVVSVESTGPACPHTTPETTARVNSAWVRSVTGIR